MRTQTLDFLNGETKSLNIPGKYFRLIRAWDSTIDVEFFLDGRSLGEKAVGVDGGYYAIHEGGFTRVDIKSSIMQTVKVAISRGLGGYDTTSGTTVVTGASGNTQLPAALAGGRLDVNIGASAVVPVNDNAGSLTVDSPQLPAALAGGRLDVNIGASAVVPVNDNAGSLTVDSPQLPAALVNGRLDVNQAHGYGVSFTNTSLFLANTPIQVVAPASNVNGAIVWAATISAMAMNYFGSVLIAKAFAPVSVTDGDVLLVAGMNVLVPGSAIGVWGNLDMPVRIPAGLGLYFITSYAEVNYSLHHCQYTLL